MVSGFSSAQIGSPISQLYANPRIMLARLMPLVAPDLPKLFKNIMATSDWKDPGLATARGSRPHKSAKMTSTAAAAFGLFQTTSHKVA
jgi:hypothetical protein